MKEIKQIFQDYMGHNVCFGCGKYNAEGLQIKSFWEGDEAVCRWRAASHHHGWKGIMNGGIMATLIDCHSMCTAMAHATRVENRALGTAPHYKYATGTMTIRYLKPTSNLDEVVLRAQVTEMKGRKTVVKCDFYSKDIKTAEAEVIAIRVFSSDDENHNSAAFSS